eukprot:1447507-Amphidinium_carterae.1
MSLLSTPVDSNTMHELGLPCGFVTKPPPGVYQFASVATDEGWVLVKMIDFDRRTYITIIKTMCDAELRKADRPFQLFGLDMDLLECRKVCKQTLHIIFTSLGGDTVMRQELYTVDRPMPPARSTARSSTESNLTPDD